MVIKSKKMNFRKTKSNSKNRKMKTTKKGGGGDLDHFLD